MKKPVVAVDVDAVLTDNFVVWSQHYKRQKCGRDHAERPPEHELGNWDRWENLCSTCWHEVIHRKEILLAHELRPGVDRALEFLSRVADLHIVTSRPLETSETLKEWLFWRDIYTYFKGVHLSHNKRQKCDEIKAVALIDDGPHNIRALEGSNTVPIIFDETYNQDLKGIRVYNWKQAAVELGKVALERSLDPCYND